MTPHTEFGSEAVRDIIEGEQRRDRWVRRASIAAWTVTLIVMLMFAGIIGMEVLRMLEQVGLGVASNRDVVDALVPLLGVLGTTSFVIALVSSAVVLLRFRTASLADIQLRLASLEAALSEEG